MMITAGEQANVSKLTPATTYTINCVDEDDRCQAVMEETVTTGKRAL